MTIAIHFNNNYNKFNNPQQQISSQKTQNAVGVANIATSSAIFPKKSSVSAVGVGSTPLSTYGGSPPPMVGVGNNLPPYTMRVEEEDSRLLRGLSKALFTGIGPKIGPDAGNRDKIFSPLPFSEGETSNETSTSSRNFQQREENPRNNQRDYKSVLEIAKKLKPRWDGNPLTWKDFWQRWEYFWKVRCEGLNVNPELKKMTFIECLPREEVDRAMHRVVVDGISFDDLVETYRANCTSLMPRFVLEKKWRQWVPVDRKWRSIDLWYSKWLALAANVGNLTDEQKIEQFDAVLLRIVPKLIERIHEEEVAGHRMSLQERWNFLSTKLQVSQVLTQIRTEFEQSGPTVSSSESVSALQRNGGGQRFHSRSPGGTSSGGLSPSLKCFNCGKEGHKKSECRSKPRGRSPMRSSGRSFARSSSRSSGRSSSSRGSFGKSRFQGRRNSRSQSSGSRGSNSGNRRFGSRSPNKKFGNRARSMSSASSGSSRRSGYRSDSRKSGYDSGSRNRSFSGKKPYPSSPHRGDRKVLIARQKSGRCLNCGSSSHKVDACPKRRSQNRPPTPRGSSSRSPSHKVNFKVANVGEEPLASGREGDEYEEDEVDDADINAFLDSRQVESHQSDQPQERSWADIIDNDDSDWWDE